MLLNRLFKHVWFWLYGGGHIDQAAFEQGRAAYKAGRGENPYPPLTYSHYSWKRGHDESLAQDPSNSW